MPSSLKALLSFRIPLLSSIHPSTVWQRIYREPLPSPPKVCSNYLIILCQQFVQPCKFDWTHTQRGLVQRMSQTLKEFRLWEGKVFNTKMGKKNRQPSSCCLFNQVITAWSPGRESMQINIFKYLSTKLLQGRMGKNQCRVFSQSYLCYWSGETDRLLDLMILTCCREINCGILKFKPDPTGFPGGLTPWAEKRGGLRWAPELQLQVSHTPSSLTPAVTLFCRTLEDPHSMR